MSNSNGALSEIFPGDSEMARLMREHDWSATPLGDPSTWPDGLKIPLRMLLTSRFEMWLGWGHDLSFFYNDAYIPTLGIKHPAMLAKPFNEVWAEVYADVEDQVARVRAGEATWNDALLLLLERSGYPEETYHSFSYSPLYDADGSVGGMLCVVSEDTERVISERRLATLRRLGMELVGATEPEDVSAAICSVLGANRRDFPFALVYLAGEEGLVGLGCTPDAAPLLDRTWPLDADPSGKTFDLPPAPYPAGDWDCQARQALAVAIPGPGEQPPFGTLILGLNPYRRDDPAVLDFARLIAGQLSGALANVATLKAERQRAQMIWEHARDLMVVVDAEGIFRSVSPAWTRMLGHPVEQVVGRNFSQFIDPRDAETSATALAEALGEGDLTGYENRFRTLDGEYRWISWHTAKAGDLVYAYGRDVTEQKANSDALAAAEDALRQAQKMEALGQLTGGIAHDFNNLLTGIIGSLDMMERKALMGKIDEAEHYISTATVCANRAASLTQRLLAFSRRQSLDPKPVDPHALVRGMEDLLRRSISENIEVAIVSKDGLWRAKCDPNQLESAILNLAINSRDAMAEGGRLTISIANAKVDEQTNRAGPAGDYVVIAVTDTGHGMTQDVRAQVFDPFFTTKPLGQGTGLGLSMIYGFARQSGGFVTIDSEVDRGTTVSLYLPRCDDAALPEDTRQLDEREEIAGCDTIILVVEDEPDVRALVIDALDDLGYHLLQASDGPGGLEMLRSQPRIDLLLTDVGLPGLNGRQLADAALELHPDMKVLFMTGYAHDASAGDSLLSPGMDVILKPFTLKRLADKVRSIVAADNANGV